MALFDDLIRDEGRRALARQRPSGFLGGTGSFSIPSGARPSFEVGPLGGAGIGAPPANSAPPMPPSGSRTQPMSGVIGGPSGVTGRPGFGQMPRRRGY